MKNTGLVIVLLLFFGCGDELGHDSRLIGDWLWIETRYYDDLDSAPTGIETSATEGCGQQITFYNDGRFYWSYVDCAEEGDELSQWSTQGYTLTFNDRGEKNNVNYEIEGDSLRLTKNEDGWAVEVWLKD